MQRSFAVFAGSLASLIVLGLALAGPANAARQAICEHPEGSRCVAINDTGRIECSCLDGEYEQRNPDITGADDAALMDACWDAWTVSCAPWKLWTSCEAPDRGACDITGAGGGQATCDCISGETIDDDGLEQLQGLGADALDDACHEQLDRLCAPPPPPAAAPAMPMEITDEPEAAACSVAPRGQASGLTALLLAALALGRRRRRR